MAAVSLAAAGVTLVQVVSERGMLGPGARIALAGALGAALLGAGEVIRRRGGDEGGPTAALPSTFSGAGVVVLFAAVLAARTLYGLIGPGAALGLLVAVAALAVALGWLYGPFLAAVGVVGAMAAPFLVGGDPGDPTLVYAHLGAVALAGLLIDAARRWRWVSVLSLGAAFGAALLLFALAGGAVALMVLASALAAMAVAIPGGRLVPRHRGPTVAEVAASRLSARPRRARWPRWEVRVAGGAMAAACGAIVLAAEASEAAFWTASLLLVALFAVPTLWGRRAPALADLALWPAAALVAAVALQAPFGPAHAAWIAAIGDPETAPRRAPALLLAAGAAMALMAAWRSARERRASPRLAWAGAAALLPPLVVAALEVTWRPAPLMGATAWALHALAAAALATVLAERLAALDRPRGDLRRASLMALSALGLIAFALVVVLSEAALTVALSVVVLAAAMLARRTGLRLDAGLVAGAAALLWRGVAVPGLPWAAGAGPGELLLAYGASVAALAGVLAVLRPAAGSVLGRAAEMALVLLAATGASALLVRVLALAGAPPATHWSVGLVASLWLAAALAQLALASGERAARAARLVTAALSAVVASALLLAGAVLLNPAVMAGERVAGPPFVNTLIPAYLLPAALLAAGRWAARIALPVGMGAQASGAGLAALYAVLAIRHAWRGAEGMARPGVGDGELYTYTVALLLLGSGLLYLGASRGSRPLRLAANAVLVAAIAKVFLVDAAGLQGLARSASFLALGLCLAGLAWLNRRLIPRA